MHMSKFEAMSQAVNDYRKRWIDYEQRCVQVAKGFVQGFSAYCEMPSDSVTFSPLDREPKEGTRYSLRGAMHFGDDAWWHLGLILILTPGQRILLELCFNEDNKGMLFRLGAKGNVEPLNLNDPLSLHQQFEELVSIVKKFYAAKPQDQSTSSRKIGFDNSGIMEANEHGELILTVPESMKEIFGQNEP
jgi:hypothetical protein